METNLFKHHQDSPPIGIGALSNVPHATSGPTPISDSESAMAVGRYGLGGCCVTTVACSGA